MPYIILVAYIRGGRAHVPGVYLRDFTGFMFGILITHLYKYYPPLQVIHMYEYYKYLL